MALDQRPALRAAQLQQDAMEQERKATKAEFGPKIGLFGSTERDAMTLGGPSGTNWTAGAQLEFNIFAGGAQKAQACGSHRERQQGKTRHGVVPFGRADGSQESLSRRERGGAAHSRCPRRFGPGEREPAHRAEPVRSGAHHCPQNSSGHRPRNWKPPTGYLAALQDWQVARAQLERAAGVLTPESTLVTGADKP